MDMVAIELNLSVEAAKEVRVILRAQQVRGLTFEERPRSSRWAWLLGQYVAFHIQCPAHFEERLHEMLDEWGQQWQADWSW